MSVDVDVVGQWVDWMSMDNAQTTVAAYQWELRAVEKFFPDRRIVELTATDLARYIAQRRMVPGKNGRGCSDATIRRTVNALKSFYKFAFRGKLRNSPARRLPMPSVKKKKQRALKFAQSFQLMAACDTSTVRGKRDLAIVCLLLDTGLREAEVCRLRLSDVDMEHQMLTVKIKGGADGDGLFSRETQAALAAWLAMRPMYARSGIENFFVSVGGNLPGEAITPSGLRVIFRRLAKQAGFEKLSPHDLRRSFATQLVKLGAPTRTAQMLGRWEEIDMVVGYTLTLEIEADEFQHISPVAHALGQNS